MSKQITLSPSDRQFINEVVAPTSSLFNHLKLLIANISMGDTKDYSFHFSLDNEMRIELIRFNYTTDSSGIIEHIASEFEVFNTLINAVVKDRKERIILLIPTGLDSSGNLLNKSGLIYYKNFINSDAHCVTFTDDQGRYLFDMHPSIFLDRVVNNTLSSLLVHVVLQQNTMASYEASEKLYG